MKKIAILQSNYIPWKGYFDIIRHADVFVIYDEVQYTKNDWRNRNLIKTSNGTEWLTIPVSQKTLHQRIDETTVTQKNWSKKHWKTLVCNYAKAPYFKNYAADFEDFYSSIDEDNLSEINLRFIKKINSILDIKSEIVDSKSLKLSGDKNDRLIDAIKKLNGTHYISGPAAKNYIDIDKFQTESISIEWMNYSGYPLYSQLFGPFTHEVTILDLIFNEGPNAKLYLKDL